MTHKVAVIRVHLAEWTPESELPNVEKELNDAIREGDEWFAATWLNRVRRILGTDVEISFEEAEN